MPAIPSALPMMRSFRVAFADQAVEDEEVGRIVLACPVEEEEAGNAMLLQSHVAEVGVEGEGEGGPEQSELVVQRCWAVAIMLTDCMVLLSWDLCMINCSVKSPAWHPLAS
mmetsp:Transcript_37719/g.97776  ORF Transcript_37719/g.97776 Transcript_37719/m.97776 type:complete len:111 (-) Transcript_37719:190-522(-)